MRNRHTIIVTLFLALLPLSASVVVAQEGNEAESEPGFFSRLFGFGQAEKADERADEEERAREARKAREEQAKREETDRKHGQKHREMEREHARDHEEDAREHAADRGRKKGWVNGMPPGQAKNRGKGHQQRERDAREHGEPEYEVDDARAETSASTPNQQKKSRSAEDILRDAAKDEAVRASGVAEGSAEEELIRIGTDAAIDKAK